MMPVIAHNALESVRLLSAAVGRLHRAVASTGSSPNAERCAEMIE